VFRVGEEAAHHRRGVHAVHLHEQLVERHAAAHHPAHHAAGKDAREALPEALHDRRVERARALRARREQLLAPRARLEDQVAAGVQRAVRTVEGEVVEGLHAVVERPADAAGARHRGALPERLAAQADGVDLVDEDDALPAPLAREATRAGDHQRDDDHVHADEHLREARARHRHDRRVEARRDALREHRLAGARRADEQQAALGLAAGLAELLARLPQGDHARDLLLLLALPAHVVEVHAPVGVAGLVALELAHRHQHHRAEEDPEVDQEQQRQLQQQHQQRPAGVAVAPAEDAADAVQRAAQVVRVAENFLHDVDRDEQRQEGARDPEDVAEQLAPVPQAPPRASVLGQFGLVDALQARARDQAVRHDVDQPAEGDHAEERPDQRPEQAPAVAAVEQDEQHRARQQRDERRRAAEPAPLARELRVLGERCGRRGAALRGAHGGEGTS
jgi:hypothetical protein